MGDQGCLANAPRRSPRSNVRTQGKPSSSPLSGSTSIPSIRWCSRRAAWVSFVTGTAPPSLERTHVRLGVGRTANDHPKTLRQALNDAAKVVATSLRDAYARVVV